MDVSTAYTIGNTSSLTSNLSSSNNLSQQELKQQLQSLLVSLQKSSDILVGNIQQVISQSNKTQLTPFNLQPENSSNLLTQLGTLIFSSQLPILAQVFQELSIVKAFELLLGKVFKELTKLSDDYVKLIHSKIQSDQDQQLIANQILQVIHQSLLYMTMFGRILDYLMVDHYKVESIISQFEQQRTLLKMIISIMLDFSKLIQLQKQINTLYLKKQNEDEGSDETQIVVKYARILFNLIISQNNHFKQQFIEEQGLYILKKILKKSFTELEFEIYFYSLGIIPPIISTYPSHKQDFIDNGYCALLTEHLKFMYEQANYIHLSAPLFLAIRSLIQKSEEIKKEFVSQPTNLDLILDVALRSHQSSKLKNIHISSVILICECGISKFEELIKKRIENMESEKSEALSNPGTQVQLKEQIWRLQEQNEYLKKCANSYTLHAQALDTLRNSIFDDESLEKALSDLNKIWIRSAVTKSFFVSAYGNVDFIIQCLKNVDENVMLNAGKCILTLLEKEEGALDLFIRHKGIQILKSCTHDYNTDIKKTALRIILNLINLRDDIKSELLVTGVLDQCITNIQQYPDDDIDYQILSLSLEVLALSVSKHNKILQLVQQKNVLSSIVLQFKLIIDQLMKGQIQNQDQNLQILIRLTQAINNIVSGNHNFQDQLRESQLLPQIVNYLNKALDSKFAAPIFSEKIVIDLLSILINAIDTHQNNQEYIVKTFKTYDLVKNMLFQDKSLILAGQTALFLSHLVWTNLDSQALFSTREILKRIIFLIDFNQLVNESEVESSTDTLMEISFFALLALINLTHNNLICQQLVAKMGGFDVIVNQLRSPSYDPKKTACLCLSNLVQNNQDNAIQLLDTGAVAVLVYLINDEEDDDLSNRAYQCLESMGQIAVIELVTQIQLLTQSSQKWKNSHTVMLDVFRRRERHIYMHALSGKEDLPSLRDFGPQDEDQLLNQKNLWLLEKTLPVLNGLLYQKKENREVIWNSLQAMTDIFSIFQYQLPIEIHENALNALLNLLSDAPKSLKEQLVTGDLLKPCVAFLSDLNQLEHTIMRKSEKFLIIDYGVKVNYQREAAQLKDEKTVEEMQETLFEQRVYEYDNATDQMFYIEPQNQERILLNPRSKAFAGQGLKKHEVVRHIQDLKSIGYSIMNNLTMGNAKLGLYLVQQLYQNLPEQLFLDINQLFEESELADNLIEEALEMILNLIAVKEIFNLFAKQIGNNFGIEYMGKLKKICVENKVGGQQKNNLIVSKITHVINEQSNQ